MGAINNKDILNSLVELFSMLDPKIKAVNDKMIILESSIKAVNNAGIGADAKLLVENTKKLNDEVKKLTDLEKAQLNVDKQIQAAKIKIIELDDDRNKQLEIQKRIIAAKNKEVKAETDIILGIVTANNKLTDAEKAQLKIKQQIETANAKLIASQSEEAKQLAKINEQLIHQNKQNKSNAQELLGQVGAYKKLATELNNARNKYKDMAASEQEATKEGKALLAQITQMDAKIKKIDASVGQFQRNVGNYGSAITKLGRDLVSELGFVGGMTAVVMVLKNAYNKIKEFQQEAAKLSSITGVTGKALEALKDSAKEMSAQFGISATEIVKAYTVIGSKMPILLQNAKALEYVTDKVLTLSQATGMDLNQSADAASAILNQFGLSAGNAGKIINELAAGSLEGSAEVNDLTESFKNFGTIAKDSNLTTAQSIALLEVLAEKQILGAEAGTKARGALLKLKEAGLGYKSGIFNLNDASDEFNKKLATLGTQLEKDAYAQKIFGTENITVGKIITQNTDKFNELTDKITGTNVAYEQQSKMMDTLTGDTAKMSSAWENFILGIESGNGRISKTIRSIIQMFTSFITTISDLNKGDSFITSTMRQGSDVAGQARERIAQDLKDVKKIEDEKTKILKDQLDKKLINQKEYESAIAKIKDNSSVFLDDKLKSYEKSSKEFEIKLGVIKKEIAESLILDPKNTKSNMTRFLKQKEAELIIDKEITDKIISEMSVNTSVPASGLPPPQVGGGGTKTESKAQKDKEDKLKIEQKYLQDLEDAVQKQHDDEVKLAEEKAAKLKNLDKDYADSKANDLEAYKEMELMKYEWDKEIRDKAAEEEKERQQELAAIVMESATQTGQIIGDLFAKGQLTFKEFSKQILIMALDLIQKKVILAQFEILMNAFKVPPPLNIAAIAKAAILIGALTAVFQVAKAKVQNFAKGINYVDGPGTETSDSIPVNVSKGEGISRASINKRMLALGVGVNDPRLPGIVENGLMNTAKMEGILEEMKYYNKMTSFYLSNGINAYENEGFIHFREWRTGADKKIPKK